MDEAIFYPDRLWENGKIIAERKNINSKEYNYARNATPNKENPSDN